MSHGTLALWLLGVCLEEIELPGTKPTYLCHLAAGGHHLASLIIWCQDATHHGQLCGFRKHVRLVAHLPSQELTG